MEIKPSTPSKAESHDSVSPTHELSQRVLPKKKLLIASGVLLVIIIVGSVLMLTLGRSKDDNQRSSESQQTAGDAGNIQGDSNSLDPVQKGKYLARGNCEGTGSKKLTFGPMNPSDISVILPYGLVAGGHVTPVDHQYFLGKDQSAAPNTYDVLAPADGTLVDVSIRPRGQGKIDVRGVISYSCTFFSYFDLANSLSDEIAAQMPAGWDTNNNGPQTVKIPVKAGQVIAKVGGQTLDYAVWDTTKSLKGLLVPLAYNNYEPWKLHTVEPTAYYTDEVKMGLLPLYARNIEPRDGKIDFDIDGTASGNWFKSGTNGYIGAFKESAWSSSNYADGHLSLAPSLYDPTGWIFSTGAINHGVQYGIKTPSPTPDKVVAGGAAVKYELVQMYHTDEKGDVWLGKTVPKSLKLSYDGVPEGTALVQLTSKRELKVEVFLNKKSSQVNGFTNAAATYTRGDEATIMIR